MFWKKKSDAYNHLVWKLARYVNIRLEWFGSKEYLPTKSELDNLSEGELEKFIEKQIFGSIKIYENQVEAFKDVETDDIKKIVASHKEESALLYKFLEALEAGGLREQNSEKNDSEVDQDLISLINKKDGSAVTYFLNNTIENQDEVVAYQIYSNSLFNLFKFFVLERTPTSYEFESGNFLEGLSFFYDIAQEMAETKVPDEVKDYIANGQMESELNGEHFKILKEGIHNLCLNTQDEFDTLKNYLGFTDLETHTHLTYILYSKNNPKMTAIQLNVDDSELDILYKEFTELLNEDELNTLYENAEKYRTEYIEELVEKVNKERTKRLDYENYSVDLSAYLSLASNYALDANIAGRLKGKALLQEILDQKIADDAQEEEAKKYLEWF